MKDPLSRQSVNAAETGTSVPRQSISCPGGQTFSYAEALGIRPGITAVIGGGGKTTLLRMLAEDLAVGACHGSESVPRVILCTSTHIFPFREYPCVETPDLAEDTASGREIVSPAGPAADAIRARIDEAFLSSPIVCVGTPEPRTGKYKAPSVSFDELLELSDYVLVEADGSRHHPFKAHTLYEPVIPDGTKLVVYVAGAFGFMKPIREAVHRPELFCAQMNARLDPGALLTPESLLTPELAAAHIGREKLADICCLFLSGADTDDMNSCPGVQDCARRFEASLAVPLVTIRLSP